MPGKRLYFICLLGATICLAADRGEESQPPQQSGRLPGGMVAFFTAPSCPEGWVEDTLAQGRIVVAAAKPAESGAVQGEPFADNQAAKHDHAFSSSGKLEGSLMPTLPPCCFTLKWVTPQTFSVQGRTGEQDSSLPLYAMRMCRQKP